MNYDDATLEINLEELRTSFDQSFTFAPKEENVKYHHLILFTIAQEHFALPLNYVQEVLKVPYIVKVPCAPPAILGIMNLNGVIVSVSSVHHIFDLPQSETTAMSRVIVTKNLKFQTGLLVDSIKCVMKVKQEDVQPPLTTLSTTTAECLEGEFYVNDDLVILLDMERFVTSPKIQVK